MRYAKVSIVMLLVLALAALFGCGSANKEGDTSGAGSVPGYTNVGDGKCVQCHSAVMDPLTGVGIVAQYEQNSPHKDSPHANGGNGCEACHGGGSQHNGVGPIPYPNPFDGNGTRCAECHAGKYQTNAPTKFASSNHANIAIETGSYCRRCHTHEGAVIGMVTGFTGSNGVLANSVYQGQFPLQNEFTALECSTCHQHGAGLRSVKARDNAGNVVNWNPSNSLMNAQYNLCTGCHTMKSYDGSAVLASGNIVSYAAVTLQTQPVGAHGDRWFRTLATTHLDYSDNTPSGSNGITGYVMRMERLSEEDYASTTNPQAKVCFDCHGHEWKTNTGRANPLVTSGSRSYLPENETIWTEWAKSGHAGKILVAKNNAAGSATSGNVALTDAVMVAAVNDTTAAAWNHYDWSNGTVGSSNRQTCQRCHTATGASNYLNGPATYNNTKNDFQHLAGWSASSKSSTQRELLYCWGCHANVEADKGGLRNPGAMTADYNFNGAKAQFPNVESSNVCIACHQGQASGETITSLATATTTSWGNVSFVNSHYMAVAGVMYNKIGFIAFTAPSTTTGNSSAPTYGGSLTSVDDGGNISSTHRNLGSSAIIGTDGITASDTQYTSGGPCTTCHMTKIGDKRHHTWEIDENAFNNVCSKCHTSEGSTTLTSANFISAFVDPQGEQLQAALAIALDILSTKYHITFNQAAYPYFYDADLGAPSPATAVKDWTRPSAPAGPLSNDNAMKLMGACFNINLLTREPAAFAHARTYTRRLIFDTIDFLDDLGINMSVSATATGGVYSSPSYSYLKGSCAYTGDVEASGTTLCAGTTENMTYLNRYSRSTGKWSSPERP